MIGKAVYFSESHRVRLVFEPDGSTYIDVDHLTPDPELERMVLHANLRGFELDYARFPVEAHKKFVRHHLTPMEGVEHLPFDEMFSKRACSPNCPTCAYSGLT